MLVGRVGGSLGVHIFVLLCLIGFFEEEVNGGYIHMSFEDFKCGTLESTCYVLHNAALNRVE